MPKKTAINSDILYDAKQKTSPKIYELILKLVNEHREDLAKVVLRIDYLLQYANNSIRQKEFDEAREALNGAKMRMDMLKKNNVDLEHIEYLYDGIYKKLKQ
ncbi:MAG: hypothetical protein ABF633_16315 [Clostridium sp.]|uniref:hypothetical protein n=1 Tax=Clostridium sp. TaxID=1506 RepID=UPI0039E9A720